MFWRIYSTILEYVENHVAASMLSLTACLITAVRFADFGLYIRASMLGGILIISVGACYVWTRNRNARADEDLAEIGEAHNEEWFIGDELYQAYRRCRLRDINFSIVTMSAALVIGAALMDARRLLFVVVIIVLSVWLMLEDSRKTQDEIAVAQVQGEPTVNERDLVGAIRLTVLHQEALRSGILSAINERDRRLRRLMRLRSRKLKADEQFGA
jgi:hypothetical protein